MASPGRSDSKGDKSPRAGEKKATEAAAASGGGDGEKAPAGMTRLPEQEVTQILSLDPHSIEPYTVDALRKFVQEVPRNAPEAALRALAKLQNESTRKRYVAFQDWVREELDDKGYVEVPDEFVRDREEAKKQHLVGQADLCLPNDYFTTVEDDDGEEEFVFSFVKEETESDEDEEEDDDDEESDEEDEESDEDDD